MILQDQKDQRSVPRRNAAVSPVRFQSAVVRLPRVKPIRIMRQRRWTSRVINFSFASVRLWESDLCTVSYSPDLKVRDKSYRATQVANKAVPRRLRFDQLTYMHSIIARIAIATEATKHNYCI